MTGESEVWALAAISIDYAAERGQVTQARATFVSGLASPHFPSETGTGVRG